MSTLGTKLRHAWNAFNGRNIEPPESVYSTAASYGYFKPDRTRLNISNERSIVSAVLTRISIDVASVRIRHVRVDDNERYLEDIQSGLNYCLTTEANLDQAARAFRQDVALTLLDKGTIAIVPTDTDIDPRLSGGFDIKKLRVGHVTTWYPQHVRVSVYNEDKGVREEVVLDKKFVAIVENPLYSIMNEPNSTLQRLILKLNMLDAVDKLSSSGKLDLIIQLPYTIKSETRRQQATQRIEDIEFQLRGSQYGIAYLDATEKVTQLNRPADNNLLKQIEYLTQLLYSQLGITEAVMNGTADEKAMLNYMNRTIEPILSAIVEEMNRVFLTKTARSQKQLLMSFADPFRLVPISEIAEIADKFTRNEIFTSNEIRQIIGVKPASDPKADELRNSNMPQPAIAEDISQPSPEDVSLPEDTVAEDDAYLDEALSEIEAAMDETLAGLEGV